MSPTGTIRHFLYRCLAIKQISYCPLLFLLSMHHPCSFLLSTFSLKKEGSWNMAVKNKRKRCSVFFLKAGYWRKKPVSCLGICFPVHATPVINWLWDSFIGMSLWLAVEQTALLFVIFFNAPLRQEEMDFLFLANQVSCHVQESFYCDTLRECLMSSIKCQSVHKKSWTIICFKDFKSWPWSQRPLGSPVRPFIGSLHYDWYAL